MVFWKLGHERLQLKMDKGSKMTRVNIGPSPKLSQLKANGNTP